MIRDDAIEIAESRVFSALLETVVEHSSNARFEEPVEEVQRQPINLAAIAEDQVAGNPGSAKAREDLPLPVDFYLHEACAAVELLRQLRDDRQLPDTLPSPVGVKVDKDYAARLRNLRCRRFRRQHLGGRRRDAPAPDEDETGKQNTQSSHIGTSHSNEIQWTSRLYRADWQRALDTPARRPRSN
jgi:hypothetical protein